MSEHKLLISQVIFDRSKNGISDVPVFSASFQEKKESLRFDPVLRYFSSQDSTFAQKPSSLQGDPSRGQTLGFPLREEKTRFQISLREEPSLFPHKFSSQATREWIIQRSNTNAIVNYTAVSSVRLSKVEENAIRYLQEGAIQQPRIQTQVSKRHTYSVRSKFIGINKKIVEQVIFVVEKSQRSGLGLSKKVGKLFIKVLLTTLRYGKRFGVNGIKTLHSLNSVGILLRKRVQRQLEVSKRFFSLLTKYQKSKVKQTVLFQVHTLQSVKSRVNLSFKPQKIHVAIRFPSIKRTDAVQLVSKGLITGSLVLALFTVLPMVVLQGQEWVHQWQVSLKGKADVPIAKEELRGLSQASSSASFVAPPVDEQFQLVIPKLGASMKVIPNVDPNNEAEYDAALKRGVAHVKGTNLPGENSPVTKTIYIFGHSTNAPWNIARYNALFYSIKDLKPGDEIMVWFWGKLFHYTVAAQKIIPPDDVSYLQPQMEADKLILQTCWPPGTTWNRLLVIATPSQ